MHRISKTKVQGRPSKRIVRKLNSHAAKQRYLPQNLCSRILKVIHHNYFKCQTIAKSRQYQIWCKTNKLIKTSLIIKSTTNLTSLQNTRLQPEQVSCLVIHLNKTKIALFCTRILRRVPILTCLVFVMDMVTSVKKQATQ